MYLPHKIRIELNTPTKDDDGNDVDHWAHFSTVDAHYRAASVSEFNAGGMDVAKATGAFKIRPLAGLKAHMRIVWDGSIFDIQGVLRDDRSAQEYMTLPVNEVQP